MNLGIKSRTFAPSENQEWLASRHGTQEADSITLDRAACVAVFADGVVPSGIPLRVDTATGRYVPALDNGATVADDVAVGHLLTTIDFTSGGDVPAGSAPDSPAALLWHGEVIISKVPAYAGRTDLTVPANQARLVRYV